MVLIEKVDKGPIGEKAYKPISLLNVFGKVLEAMLDWVATGGAEPEGRVACQAT